MLSTCDPGHASWSPRTRKLSLEDEFSGRGLGGVGVLVKAMRDQPFARAGAPVEARGVVCDVERSQVLFQARDLVLKPQEDSVPGVAEAPVDVAVDVAAYVVC